MRKTRRKGGVLIGIFLFPLALLARAEEEGVPLPPVKSPLIQQKQKRGKRREQKETEGTEAPERFEADTILKSPYTLDGHPLEVDPD